MSSIENEIQKLVEMNVINKADPVKNQVLSPILLRPKIYGEYRMVLNF